MSTCSIRLATRADADAINSIQNYYVERSTATFLTEPLTLQERASPLAHRQATRPSHARRATPLAEPAVAFNPQVPPLAL